MLMEERSYTATARGYRFGFNGQEGDDEVSGEGNSLDFGARIYDSRLGRLLSVDAYHSKYPDISPYCFSLNNPLVFADPSGDTVVVKVTMKKVGTTKINLYSSDEMKANSNLKNKTITVPVYEVTVNNETGSTATYYFTRISYRGDKNNPNDDPTERTFDVLNNGDRFLGKIRDRWGTEDYVLELRDLNDINNQTVKGKIGKELKDRTAIQFHVKGASDGCLLAVGSGQFETTEEGVTIDETNLAANSGDSQKSFMAKIKELRKEDIDNGNSEVIIIEFEQMYKDSDSSNDDFKAHKDAEREKRSITPSGS